MTCDFCGKQLDFWYYDGKTSKGPWACMCELCFFDHGIGLGMGKGQKFELVNDVWKKVKG